MSCRTTSVAAAAMTLCMLGCVQTQVQPEATKKPGSEAEQVCNVMLTDPAIDPARGKISINVDDISAAMRANRDYPTGQERLATHRCRTPSRCAPRPSETVNALGCVRCQAGMVALSGA